MNADKIDSPAKKLGEKFSRVSHPLYRKWRHILNRCENPWSKDWEWYGGAGVKVCEPWRADFINFLNDMAAGWIPGVTIERKDPFGNYTPENCIWATRLQQSRNKRNTKRFEHDGRLLTLGQWSEITGIRQGTLFGRIRTRKWPISKALTTPVEVTR